MELIGGLLKGGAIRHLVDVTLLYALDTFRLDDTQWVVLCVDLA